MPHSVFNLLTKDEFRAILADEIEEDRPEVAVVIKPLLLPGAGK